MTKLNYQLLTSAISVDTIKFLFEEEAQFLKKHIWLFTDQQPEILLGFNSGSLTLGQLQHIRTMMKKVEEQEEATRKQAEVEAEWEAKVAASKERQTNAVHNPASLTGSHRAY